MRRPNAEMVIMKIISDDVADGRQRLEFVRGSPKSHVQQTLSSST